MHKEASSNFFESLKSESINFNKKSVNYVIDESQSSIKTSFIGLIQEYHEYISSLIIDIEYEYEYPCFDFRARVKQKDSIINKLLHYKVNKEEVGGVPINKCLNDLLGFRITVENFDYDNQDIYNLCNSIKNEYRINGRNSSKDEYKATHIYFYGEYKYFPWELQIWNPNDAINNEISHKNHKSKRQYIHWPQTYVESMETESESYSVEGGDK
ncbi:GTP pyrophosphokinase [Paenibacillus hunanensis]|nr:GTP pyrophosphokinase [Paenibacillus hunanensis]